jgi:hypothetical protein
MSRTTLRTFMLATCLAAMPALALAQEDGPPKHSAAIEDPVPESSHTPMAFLGHFGIGATHASGYSALSLLAGVSARVGPLFVQANALDVAAEPGAGLGYDYVDDNGGTSCEDSDGEIVDNLLCDSKTPSVIHRGVSVDASVFVPHTHMLIGAGDCFDHGTQTVFGSVGYAFMPDDTRAWYILSVSAGEHYVAATIGVAVPFFTR